MIMILTSETTIVETEIGFLRIVPCSPTNTVGEKHS